MSAGCSLSEHEKDRAAVGAIYGATAQSLNVQAAPSEVLPSVWAIRLPCACAAAESASLISASLSKTNPGILPGFVIKLTASEKAVLSLQDQ
ncbi:hypothetical protein [endosymbiont of Ridgeia piscesae]|jgi:hypothetical protein|uniref:hypothetical protein n=1 Tax=endosymbiont of Ridgeia piscesae TaxID=54398 RepID=UPI0012F9E9AF|nr:hypothetical protein [endosymbiont of Ridgeia piscesae]